MKKQDLIKELSNAALLEEDHTPLVARFFIQDFDWGNIDSSRVEKAKEMIKIIHEQTMNHQRTLKKMILEIKESDKDEF